MRKLLEVRACASEAGADLCSHSLELNCLPVQISSTNKFSSRTKKLESLSFEPCMILERIAYEIRMILRN